MDPHMLERNGVLTYHSVLLSSTLVILSPTLNDLIFTSTFLSDSADHFVKRFVDICEIGSTYTK